MQKTLQQAAAVALILAAVFGRVYIASICEDIEPPNACEMLGDCEE